MTIKEKIRDEKLQYDVTKEATKTSALININTLQVKKYDLSIKVEC